MVSPGMIVVAAAAYFGGFYGVVLFVLCYGIMNGGFAVVHAIANPAWYQMQCVFAGVRPSMGNLLLTKATVLAIQVASAIHVGKTGGYI